MAFAIINDQLIEVDDVVVEESEVLAIQTEANRSLRNKRIAETDWWALSDRTMTAEQTAYRQALRDITDQAGFPTDITWHQKPEATQ